VWAAHLTAIGAKGSRRDGVSGHRDKESGTDELINKPVIRAVWQAGGVLVLVFYVCFFLLDLKEVCLSKFYNHLNESQFCSNQ